jgi:hypothetical protein
LHRLTLFDSWLLSPFDDNNEGLFPSLIYSGARGLACSWSGCPVVGL